MSCKHFIKKAVQLLSFSLFAFVAQTQNQAIQQSQDDILWYDQQANAWNEALPLGNGRLGIMVFGKTTKDRIQLNDDSLWPNDLDWDYPAGNKKDIDDIRQLLFEGRHREADSLFVDKFSRKSIVRSHQTLGDLFFDFNHENITGYRRELNLHKGISRVWYKSNGDIVQQKHFVSHPHRAILIEYSAEGNTRFSGKIRMSRPDDHGHPTVKVTSIDNNILSMKGEVTQYGGRFDSKPAPIKEGVRFQSVLKLSQEGGKVSRGDNFLEVKDAKQIRIIIVSNSSYYHENFELQNFKDLASLEGKAFAQLEAEHIRDHKKLYSRVELKLGGHEKNALATNKRLDLIKKGESDPALEALLFNYGRYLLIASSRKGSNPANLQGLWNEHIEAPWNADYHLNINLQMNYWPANLTGLDELNDPLFYYVDKLVENGKTTAKQNFGCRGSFFPHATDLWAPTWLRAPTAYWGCSMGAGGWMMQHYWNHFEYTLDTTFLRERAYPAIREVAQFYSDWLIEDPRDGTLISAPSTSPENRFISPNGEKVASCLGSAMDQQVISEVFDNFLEASKLLEKEGELVLKIKQQRKDLRPGFVIGGDGRILEWDRKYDEPEPGHRHMSQLYGFHPGNAISIEENPEIFNAIRKTLDYRLENGGAGTGWSRAWLINCSARLMDAEMAHEHIQLLLKKSLYINLFDAHPPFQIDGNFGFTSGVSEMLLQSYEKDIIRLLPALPGEWTSGSVYGLKARGNVTASMDWKDGKLSKAILIAGEDISFNLLYENKKIPLDLKKGEVYHFIPE